MISFYERFDIIHIMKMVRLTLTDSDRTHLESERAGEGKRLLSDNSSGWRFTAGNYQTKRFGNLQRESQKGRRLEDLSRRAIGQISQSPADKDDPADLLVDCQQSLFLLIFNRNSKTFRFHLFPAPRAFGCRYEPPRFWNDDQLPLNQLDDAEFCGFFIQIRILS